MPYARVKNELPIIPGYDSGDIVTIDAAAAPLNKCVVDILPVQSGTGEPSPTNIRPISGWSSVNVTRCGKNFIDLTLANLESGSINGNTGALETATNRVRNKDYYPFPFDKLYNGNYVLTIPSGYSIAMRFYDSTGTYITMSGASTGWLTSLPSDMYGKGVAFVKFVFRKSDNSDITPSSISALTYLLETGSTATAYEPYTGTTATIPFGQTVYGGNLDVRTGVLTVTKGYIAEYDGETLPSDWICDRAVYASGTTPPTGSQVVYTLATPTTVQLTPTEVKTILGNNNIFADSGDVDIIYIRRS